MVEATASPTNRPSGMAIRRTTGPAADARSSIQSTPARTSTIRRTASGTSLTGPAADGAASRNVTLATTEAMAIHGRGRVTARTTPPDAARSSPNREPAPRAAPVAAPAVRAAMVHLDPDAAGLAARPRAFIGRPRGG